MAALSSTMGTDLDCICSATPPSTRSCPIHRSPLHPSTESASHTLNRHPATLLPLPATHSASYAYNREAEGGAQHRDSSPATRQPGGFSRWHYPVKVRRTQPPALGPKQESALVSGMQGDSLICDRLAFPELTRTDIYIYTLMPIY